MNLSGGYEDAKISEASQESNTVVGQALQDVPKMDRLGHRAVHRAIERGAQRIPHGPVHLHGFARELQQRLDRVSLAVLQSCQCRLGVTQGPWEVALFARNLFDKLAATGDLLPETAQLPGRPRLFVTTPRTIGIQVRRDFGAAH